MFESLVSSADLGLPRAAECSDAELVAALTEAARREAMCAERALSYLAELGRRRLRQDEQDEVPRQHRGRGTAAEVALALTVGRGRAAALLHLGQDLEIRLPATRRALAHGDVNLAQVRTIHERTVQVEEAVLPAVEAAVLKRVIGRNAGQVARVVTEVLARLEPDALRRRREHAVSDRDVTLQPGEDGMSVLWGLLPAADGVAIDSRLQAMAQGVCAEDPRTIGQRRADALLALAHDEPGLGCACGNDGCGELGAPPRPAPLIRVLVSAATLLALDNAPGELDGYGAVDAEFARQLAGDGTWQQLLTQARADATIVPVGLGGRRPAGCQPPCPPLAQRPAALEGLTVQELDARFAADRLRRHPGSPLRAFIQLRDRTCRHPGCQVPAVRCDIDHGIPFNPNHPRSGGLTVPSNLACLCRYHHNLKTRGRWRLHHLTFGEVEFTAPTGTVVTTTPPRLDEWDQRVTDIEFDAFLDQVIHTGTRR